MTNSDNLDPATLFAVYGFIFLIIFAVLFAATIVVCLLVSKCYTQIPEKHRKMTPGQVWLLLIPCFGIIWNFFVFPGLFKSYKSYFDSIEVTAQGDTYIQVGLWYAICCAVTSTCWFIPCVSLIIFISGPAAFVLLILCLVKAFDLKEKIKA